MSKLPVISGAQCVKALEKAGFVIYRQRGSHITMIRQTPPAQTTVPIHKELDRGTLARHHPSSRTERRRVRRATVSYPMKQSPRAE
ncbi:MAG TPA: type II toxin-antitoxin system HicA family toxin [Pyrinomonadaceae bacterium]